MYALNALNPSAAVVRHIPGIWWCQWISFGSRKPWCTNMSCGGVSSGASALFPSAAIAAASSSASRSTARSHTHTVWSAAADHTVCVWDLAVERDAEEEAAAMAAEGNNALAPEDTPPQLMFVHQGLRDPKEIHWHHQIPGMCLTTAADGFNAFKAYNVGNEVA